MIEVKISNKSFYFSLVLVGLLSLSYVAYAYGTNDPKVFGHSAGEIMIKVDGKDKTLQKAIDDGDFGIEEEYENYLDDVKDGIPSQVVSEKWVMDKNAPAREVTCPDGYYISPVNSLDTLKSYVTTADPRRGRCDHAGNVDVKKTIIGYTARGVKAKVYYWGSTAGDTGCNVKFTCLKMPGFILK